MRACGGQDWAVTGSSVFAECRDVVGEGPVYLAESNALLWVDIVGRQVRRLSLAGGAVESWAMPEMVGFVVPRSAGGWLVGLASGLYAFTPEPFGLTGLIDPDPDHPEHRLNDATVDRRGRLWLGTMTPTGAAASGALLRVDAHWSVTTADRGYRIPNGPAFDRAGRRFYHADSLARTIYRFSVRDDGTLVDRQVHIVFEGDWGLPDGMTVDADDHLWVAHWDGGRLSRFDPDGRMEQTIVLPVSRVTSCAFGGPALNRLFVTSASEGRPDEPLAGAVFEVDAGGIRGLPQPAFAR